MMDNSPKRRMFCIEIDLFRRWIGRYKTILCIVQLYL